MDVRRVLGHVRSLVIRFDVFRSSRVRVLSVDDLPNQMRLARISATWFTTSLCSAMTRQSERAAPWNSSPLKYLFFRYFQTIGFAISTRRGRERAGSGGLCREGRQRDRSVTNNHLVIFS